MLNFTPARLHWSPNTLDSEFRPTPLSLESPRVYRDGRDGKITTLPCYRA